MDKIVSTDHTSTLRVSQIKVSRNNDILQAKHADYTYHEESKTRTTTKRVLVEILGRENSNMICLLSFDSHTYQLECGSWL